MPDFFKPIFRFRNKTTNLKRIIGLQKKSLIKTQVSAK